MTEVADNCKATVKRFASDEPAAWQNIETPSSILTPEQYGMRLPAAEGRYRPLYASPQPANPAQVTDAMVEMLAELLCSEFDEDFNPCHGYSWPEHKDDDGYRGGNAYVKLQPSDVQARAREGATRILTFLSQRKALTAAIGAGGQAVAEPRKGFPILGSGGQKIDWQLVADHGGQAQKNHYQSVERLAARGGLSWCELHAVLHDKPWQKMDENDAITACRALEARYLSALSQPHPADERLRELQEGKTE